METVLIFYAICASALLIWSTSRRNYDLRHRCAPPASKSRIDYVAIPSFSLRGWIACNPNLVVFDLHSKNARSAGQESFPGMLTVSMNDLPNLLKWLPPESTVVFSCGDDLERFNAEIEGTLLQVGIKAIYFLNKGVNFPLTVKWE
ncbi:MAG TPA: hypothetical protein VE957_10175 [Terriglobales bacterium]|nr:hypothetical protein [Terriglobales bacterium]